MDTVTSVQSMASQMVKLCTWPICLANRSRTTQRNLESTILARRRDEERRRGEDEERGGQSCFGTLAAPGHVTSPGKIKCGRQRENRDLGNEGWRVKTRNCPVVPLKKVINA
jgi:hypothetical protein